MRFQFGIPSLITFGAGSSEKAGTTASQIGSKVFCVYDKGVKQIAEKIVRTLKDSGLEVFEFDGVLPNPPDTLVEETASIARNADIDVIVSVGGGSSLDCAKAINILLTNPSPINQYNGMNKVKTPTKPHIAIPTTAGTGSEVTTTTIITDTNKLKKMVIGGRFASASFALADPLLTTGMPASITASTGMDALTHAIEACVARGASIMSDAYAFKAIELICGDLIEATINGDNLAARTNMLLGSMLAGIAFNSAGLGIVHSIAHPLSVHCGLSHGVANACLLPYGMEYYAAVSVKKVKDVAAAMGLDIQGLSDEEAAEKAVNKAKSLIKELNIPGLKQTGVSKPIFDRIAEDALNEITTRTSPGKPTKEAILAILEKAY
ncbi:MAG: iron-containing alcohol dehydrogenase [Dethiobacter sp.]|jgi:alcohol dehydrogenase class IV|nr:iron-containing alcohol dehydrogenase [Dethiobacter sp.]